MTRIREISLMLLTAAIILFAYQNREYVPVEFLNWQFQVSVALITLLPLLAGLLIGIAATAIMIRRRRRKSAAAEEEAAADEPEEEGDT